jgi:hypothetical protein
MTICFQEKCPVYTVASPANTGATNTSSSHPPPYSCSNPTPNAFPKVTPPYPPAVDPPYPTVDPHLMPQPNIAG